MSTYFEATLFAHKVWSILGMERIIRQHVAPAKLFGASEGTKVGAQLGFVGASLANAVEELSILQMLPPLNCPRQ